MTQDHVCWLRGAEVRVWRKGTYVMVDAALAYEWLRLGVATRRESLTMKGNDMSMLLHHAIERIMPPASEPLTLEETKHYLRVTDDVDDALIAMMIHAAREQAEHYLGTSFITQRWKMTIEHSLPSIVPLRYGLVQAIVSIVAHNEAGDAETLAPEAYRLSIDKRAIHVFSPRSGCRFEITYDAGYGASASLIPGLIRQGMLQHVAAMYEQREASAPIPAMALQAYHPYKEIGL